LGTFRPVFPTRISLPLPQKFSVMTLEIQPVFHMKKQRTNMIRSAMLSLPCDLASNVTQLHQFLFNDENYTPSATVLSNSQQIISNTGYKQGDGH